MHVLYACYVHVYELHARVLYIHVCAMCALYDMYVCYVCSRVCISCVCCMIYVYGMCVCVYVCCDMLGYVTCVMLSVYVLFVCYICMFVCRYVMRVG